MDSSISQAAAMLVVTAGLAVHVALRRNKSSLHWHFLALMVGLGVWALGAVVRQLATAPATLELAAHGVQLGACSAPALWLLLAARFARVPYVEGRPWVMALVLAPGATLFGISVLGRVMGGVAEAGLGAGPVSGPAALWSYGCVAGGVLLFLARARSLEAGREPRRAFLLALTALIPVATQAAWAVGPQPWSADPMPLSLGLSSALLLALVLRFRLLENLPLVRRDVIEHLHEGVLIADPAGSVRDANPAAERILGHAAAELCQGGVREALAELVGPEHPGLAELLAGMPGAPHVCELVAADGRRIEISAAAVRGRRGDPAGRYVLLRDRTDERQYEEMVRRSQRLESVGLLAAGIAHEVNNPLAFVRANLTHLHRISAELLLDAGTGQAAAKRHAELEELPGVVEETLEGIERITRIVASLRRLSGSAKEEAADVDPNEVVDEAVKLAGLHRTPSVRVETLPGRDLPAVRGGKGQLVQVLLNLLLNAKQALAGGAGCCIEVETVRVGDEVEIRVRDDGPGMSESVRERIFDPFFTTKGPEEGTGLGLPIAWDIVREHGGWMSVTSRPDEGSCFSVRLPGAPPGRAEAQPASFSAASAAASASSA